MYAQVVVPLPLPPLTYRVPDGVSLAAGDAVTVRVRNKTLHGVVAEILRELPKEVKFDVKPLVGPTEDFPSLGSETRRMLSWEIGRAHV